MIILKEILLNLLILIKPIKKYAALRHSTGRNNNEKEVAGIFDKISKYTNFNQKKILEIGPGHTFGLLKNALNLSASEVHAVDIYDYVKDMPQGIKYLHYDGKNIDLPSDYFDILWSWSVFEHIRYPEITVSETSRLLKKDGISIHSIDLVDHFFYTNGNKKKMFNCLKYSDLLWNLMTWNRSNYVNRIRLNGWLNLFEKNGLVIIDLLYSQDEVVKQMYKDGSLDYLKKYDEIDAITTSIFIVLRKS
jgi:SAM-dependent methyltransferase